ncbi:hypothetical protein JVT61DRAFT_10026 [Boletus reticuloceps]|uniref:Uncharacterized protein n=1 Tax=Boletus reticuloceps TaxID=495285 RepID=A0A8I3ABS7_9AGAM|nr:hypothetical protein JVT61DRAFT_10026 [Boletus reticuloceps]
MAPNDGINDRDSICLKHRLHDLYSMSMSSHRVRLQSRRTTYSGLRFFTLCKGSSNTRIFGFGVDGDETPWDGGHHGAP